MKRNMPSPFRAKVLINKGKQNLLSIQKGRHYILRSKCKIDSQLILEMAHAVRRMLSTERNKLKHHIQER